MNQGFEPKNTDIAWAPAVANLAQTTRRWGILETGGDDSGKLTQAGTPGMSVITAAACNVRIEGVESTVAAGASRAITAAHGSHPRYDLIYVTKGATSLSISSGTAAATPVPNDLPDNAVLLGIVYVASGVSSIVNANVIDTRQFTKLSNRVTVCPNGGGDYTLLATAIAAVASGATIKLLQGTHLLAGETVIGSKLLDIYGEGRNTIIKIPDSDSSDYGLRITTGFTLKNLTLDGNASNTTTGEFLQIHGDGSSSETADNICIKDIWLTNLNAEFLVMTGTGTTNCLIESVTCLDVHDTAFIDMDCPSLCDIDNISIRNNYIQTSADAIAIKVHGTSDGRADNVDISHNRMHFTGGGNSCDGINIDHLHNFNISNNIIVGHLTSAFLDKGIEIGNDCDRGQIANNVITYANYSAIFCSDSSGFNQGVISGNVITGQDDAGEQYAIYGIYDRCIILGNSISTLGSHGNTKGIQLASGSDNNVVIGNLLGDGIVDTDGSSNNLVTLQDPISELNNNS